MTTSGKVGDEAQAVEASRTSVQALPEDARLAVARRAGSDCGRVGCSL
jgi:hypothetical protein